MLRRRCSRKRRGDLRLRAERPKAPRNPRRGFLQLCSGLPGGSRAHGLGWAAQGDERWGFPGVSNNKMKQKLRRSVRKRAEEFPRAAHYALFGESGEVEVFRGRAR